MLMGIILLLSIIALSVGRYPVHPADVWATMASRIFGFEAAVTSTVQTVILDIRIPRIFAALIIGFALSVSGAAFQGTFRNPLVSPDILGVSAGAGFGATLAILYSWGSLGIAISAFAFGLLAVVLTYYIGNKIKMLPRCYLILYSFITCSVSFVSS